MKYLYWPHPDDGDIGGTEVFYARMARRGWQLERRGAFLSRFARCTPAQVCYRVELASLSPGPEPPCLPPEQVSLYEECGWQYVTGRRLIHVFRAPAGSGEPELYDDPRQQADTLRGLRRESFGQMVGPLVQTLVYLTIAVLGWRYADWRLAWVRVAPIWLLCWGLMLLFLLGAVHRVWRLRQQYRRLCRGLPLDRRHHRAWPAVQAIGWGFLAVCTGLTIWQWAGMRTFPPTAQDAGPCLVLEQLGVEGETIDLPTRNGDSEITVLPLLGGRWWDAREICRTADGQQVSLFQDVYELHSARQAMDLGPVLADTATFGRGLVPVEIDGLDWAMCGELEAIAVRGNRAAYITVICPGESDEALRAALQTLAAHWASLPPA